MPTVYEADHVIDAHLARGRLLAEGIQADVLGESLIGGLGELPALGLLRVRVGASDFERAQQVIAEWLRDLGDDADLREDNDGVLRA